MSTNKKKIGQGGSKGKKRKEKDSYARHNRYKKRLNRQKRRGPFSSTQIKSVSTKNNNTRTHIHTHKLLFEKKQGRETQAKERGKKQNKAGHPLSSIPSQGGSAGLSRSPTCMRESIHQTKKNSLRSTIGIRIEKSLSLSSSTPVVMFFHFVLFDRTRISSLLTYFTVMARRSFVIFI